MINSVTPVFEINNIEKFYGQKKVLDINHLKVMPGEIFGIVGQSGAGKSTFLRILNILESPENGEVFYHGEKIDFNKNQLKSRRQMAMVFQEPLLFRTTSYNNVAFGLKIRKLDKDRIRKKVTEMLEKVNMIENINTPSWLLSGGEAQRISFARALVIEPKVLLLDEPFGSLDPLTRIKLQDELLKILKELKITVIYVTHNQSEAFEIADRIAVLDEGEIAQIGRAEELLYRPSSSFVARFFGTENILKGKIIKQNEGLALVEAGDLKLEIICEENVGTQVTLCLRPEEILIAMPNGKIQDSARNHFMMIIRKIIKQGPTVKVRLEYQGFDLIALITKRSLEELGLSHGQKVICSFKATAVHVLKE